MFKHKINNYLQGNSGNRWLRCASKILECFGGDNATGIDGKQSLHCEARVGLAPKLDIDTAQIEIKQLITRRMGNSLLQSLDRFLAFTLL